jgi:hypothetical protein
MNFKLFEEDFDYKIIDGEEGRLRVDYPPLLLRIDFGDNANESVIIEAVDIQGVRAAEEVLFDNKKTAERFIESFTEEDARSWLDNSGLFIKTKKVSI